MKKVKTRKDRVCPYCDRVIPKGTLCDFEETRSPTFDDDENQIGIEYWKAWSCLDSGECIEHQILMDEKVRGVNL